MTAPQPPSPHDAYFLDIDGTLIALAASPRDVRSGTRLRRVIHRLSLLTGGAVALISGRALGDIDRLFPHARLPAAGQHGSERRSASGAVHRHDLPEAPLNRARAVLAVIVHRHPQLTLEDKGLSLALHYRAAPRLAAAAHRRMRAALAAAGRHYVLQRGKRVIELKPAGRDKGVAIVDFMHEPPFEGRRPVFLGDDATDEAGFRVVNRLGGYTIKVGTGPTSAHWRLPNAPAVVSWLATGLPAPTAIRRRQAGRTPTTG